MAKVMNNLVFTALLGVAIDTFNLAGDIGVDKQALATVLEHGSGGSRAAAILARTDFDTSGVAGAAALLRKDVGIALDLARAAGAAPTRVLADAANVTVEGLASAHG
jgi:3-hydroxyisobutyrate dehydrogenase-like beta-hydroxyacid dehydrogenase